MQNPVTGSGGMLFGTVRETGPAIPDKKPAVGDRIATLVSLSLTPLSIERILRLDPDSDQGTAKAALGAEGVGKDIELIVRNGYAKGRSDLTLNICGNPRRSAPSSSFGSPTRRGWRP